MNPWKTGNPDKKGRYFCLADFRDPVVMGRLSRVCRQNVPIVSNYSPEDGWSNALEEITITYWMEVPALPSSDSNP